MAVAQEARLQRSLQMEPGIERPQSALARGVQITEFKDACVNPDPIVLEETDLLLEQFLSPRKLRLLTGVENLEEIRHLEMKVNTSDTSLGNFGILLPNLQRLKVSNSTIPHIRDLGSSLRCLTVMWASRCALREIEGVSSMCNLQELYLSYNEIDDISPIGMLDQIEILDLEGNNLDDIVQVQYLAICSKLTNLTLEGNPLCVSPSPGEVSLEYDYRGAVKQALPDLKTLDDELLIEGVGSFQKHNVFDADWAYLEELQKDISLHDDSESILSDNSSRPSSGNRPSTAAFRPNTGYRPGTALRPATGFRPLTAGNRPPTVGARPATALGTRPGTGGKRPDSAGSGTEMSDASDLTMGKVICGNPSKALLSRRRLNPDASGELDTREPDIQFEPKVLEEFQKFKHKSEHTYDVLPEEVVDREEIVDELKNWRNEHEKRMVKIRETKAPQVLKIDHDDAISLSGGESSEVESDDEYMSPLRDDAYVTDDRLAAAGEEQNSKILPSVSSFLPVTSDEFPSDASLPSTKQISRDKRLNHDTRELRHSQEINLRHSNDRDMDSSDLLSNPSVTDSAFRMSDISSRHKPVIPPPSQRDIVRKQTQSQNAGSLRVNSPYGLQTGMPGSHLMNDVRPRSPATALRVNSSGLPRPPSSSSNVPSLTRNRRGDELLAQQPVLRSSSYDRPTPPPSQRPSTARAAMAISSQPKPRRQLPTVASLQSRPNPPP